MTAKEKNNLIQKIELSDLQDEYNNLPDYMRKVSFGMWLTHIIFGQLERNKDIIAIDVMSKEKREYRFTIGRLKIAS